MMMVLRYYSHGVRGTQQGPHLLSFTPSAPSAPLRRLRRRSGAFGAGFFLFFPLFFSFFGLCQHEKSAANLTLAIGGTCVLIGWRPPLDIGGGLRSSISAASTPIRVRFSAAPRRISPRRSAKAYLLPSDARARPPRPRQVFGFDDFESIRGHRVARGSFARPLVVLGRSVHRPS